MKQVGYWRGSEKSGNPGEYPELPRVEDFIDEEWDGDDRLAVIGHIYHPDLSARNYRGISRCRLCGVRNCSRTFSDGAWEWPEGLLHYIGKHRVKPPQEFIDHCVQKKIDSIFRQGE